MVFGKRNQTLLRPARPDQSDSASFVSRAQSDISMTTDIFSRRWSRMFALANPLKDDVRCDSISSSQSCWGNEAKFDSENESSAGSRTPPLSPNASWEGSASDDDSSNSPLSSPGIHVPSHFVRVVDQYTDDDIFLAPPLKKVSPFTSRRASLTDSVESYHDAQEELDLLAPLPFATGQGGLKEPSTPAVEAPISAPEARAPEDVAAAPSSIHSEVATLSAAPKSVRAPTLPTPSKSFVARKAVPAYEPTDFDDSKAEYRLSDAPAWDLSILSSKAALSARVMANEYEARIQELQHESPQWYLDQCAGTIKRRKGGFAHSAIRRVQRVQRKVVA